ERPAVSVSAAIAVVAIADPRTVESGVAGARIETATIAAVTTISADPAEVRMPSEDGARQHGERKQQSGEKSSVHGKFPRRGRMLSVRHYRASGERWQEKAGRLAPFAIASALSV